MNWIPILSVVGLYVVELSYVPQLWRLYKLKKADEFSYYFPFMNIFGRMCGVIVAMNSHQNIFGWFFLVGIALRTGFLLEVTYYRRFYRPDRRRVAPRINDELLERA